MKIDVNADIGEGGLVDDALLQWVTSANIACGGHTGDVDTMTRALLSAQKRGVSVGAHPSLPDREHFGRREFPVTPVQVEHLVVDQVGAFHEVALGMEIQPRQVKPHGALYHLLGRDRSLAGAFLAGLDRIDPRLAIVCPGHSELGALARVQGRRVIAEVFADRGYQSNGHLVARGQPGDLLSCPGEVARRMRDLLTLGRISTVDGGQIGLETDTICFHSDTEGALNFLQEVLATFKEAGILVCSWTIP